MIPLFNLNDLAYYGPGHILDTQRPSSFGVMLMQHGQKGKCTI